jgi:hypothetical protein
MTIPTGARPVAVTALLLLISACAQSGTETGTPATTTASDAAVELPVDGGDLVLRAEHTGGSPVPEVPTARLPMVSLYADGRMISGVPAPAGHPGPALPDVQERHIDPDEVQALADRALAAGVAETGDLGTPSIADASSIRFTLVTRDRAHVREAYALQETAPHESAPDPAESGLSPEQQAARAELRALLDELVDLSSRNANGSPGQEPYVPDGLAALVRPWSGPADDPAHPEADWTGPPLPGEPVGSLPDLTCVVATGEQVTSLLDAARDADTLTPWVTADGARWSVTFRPLLPDEEGCAGLSD